MYCLLSNRDESSTVSAKVKTPGTSDDESRIFLAPGITISATIQIIKPLVSVKVVIAVERTIGHMWVAGSSSRFRLTRR